MPGSMSAADVVSDLKSSLGDAAKAFAAGADADFLRLLAVALVGMQAKRPRTLLGTLTLVVDEPSVAVTQPDFVQYKTNVWGTRPPQPWSPCYPGPVPRVQAVNSGTGWALAFDPAPSYKHIAVYGSSFKFWYFGAHALSDTAELTTVQAADRPLLLLRAQAEAMRELSMRNINKPVALRDGYSGTPRNSTPAALYEALLQEWERAK